MASVNITSIKTASSGIWQGDNPLNFAFPLLILQTILIMVVSRCLAFLLKPLRQPKVIAEIAGGILLGPSAFGRNQYYMHKIFPKWSSPILETVASIGLLFFLFLVGIELDLSSIRHRSGRSAFCIALAGVSLPFLCGIGVAIVLRKTIDGADKVGFGQFVVFMGVSLSITAFPVLARILAELKMLTTRVGETAMAAAALNDVAAWILLAIAVALAGDGVGGHKKTPLVSVWVLLSGIAFVAFMMVVIRPAMNWVARRSSPEQDTDEAYICLTLAGVMVAGFVTDLIGIHSIFGAFVFGLTIPKGGQFADKLILRIEDFVSGLLLPLYFASSGLKTDVAKIRGREAWGQLALVISTACTGKILGTSAVAMLFMIPAREAVTLGVLMNTKGLVELIVLNIGKEKKVLNDETFAILVLMAVFTTFITSPIVMAIYKPARDISVRKLRKLRRLSTTESSIDELRVLACVHGPANGPSLIGLIESIRSTKKAHLKLFILHLLELTERSSSIIMVRRARKNGFPFFHRLGRAYRHDSFVRAFQGYSELGRVSVRPTTAISAMSTMHEDICHVAEEKRVAMIILPFHKQWRREGDNRQFTEIVGNAWRGVNQKVLQQAPCSVAILVDRGFGNIEAQNPSLPSAMTQRICIVFFGGPDDREALELGSKMAQHPAVQVTIVRFVEKEGLENNNGHHGPMLKPSPTKPTDNTYSISTAKMDREKELEKEKELDEDAVAEFRSKWDWKAEYTEKVAANNIVEGVLAIGRSGDHDLLIVGKGSFPSSMAAEFIDRQAEYAELGPIGDTLAWPGHGVVSSVLVIQQHDVAHAVVEAPVSRIGQCKYARSISDVSSSNVTEISKETV